MIKLSEWAAAYGVTYRTAWNWIQRGKFPLETAMSPTGRIFVVDAKPAQRAEETTVLYCRVSNHSRKQELDYQVERCKRFAEANGWTVAKVYKEVASGMNDKRPQMWKVIEAKPTRLLVENKDRLTRFGFEYLKRLCQAQGTSLVVIKRGRDGQARPRERPLLCHLFILRTPLWAAQGPCQVARGQSNHN